jgi:hypothetical protein
MVVEPKFRKTFGTGAAAGEYYIWTQDPADGTAVPSTTDEPYLNARRITLANGAVVDAWYVLP